MKVYISVDKEDMITGYASVGNINDSFQIELTEEEIKLIETENCKLVDNKVIAIDKPIKLPNPSTQDKINAQLLKQNAELKTETEKQKSINSQILLELAKLKGGN